MEHGYSDMKVPLGSYMKFRGLGRAGRLRYLVWLGPREGVDDSTNKGGFISLVMEDCQGF